METMESLRERLEALEHQTEALAHQFRYAERRLRWWRIIACSVVVLGLLSWALPSGEAQEELSPTGNRGLAQRVAALERLLKHFSRMGNEVFITGANLHIVNGLGSTDTTNGLGNLIVGYNDLRFDLNVRTGSHNMIVGDFHNFSSFGGLAVGNRHEISGAFASVSGGASNTASGRSSSVSGGIGNTASGVTASVSGGDRNTASAESASVSAGELNTASGVAASVSGGWGNTASGDFASVSGGSFNTASGTFSSVSGGLQRTAPGENNWAAGPLFADN